jgi:antitoxin component of MazEF toxin-antitoxin module
MKTKELKITRIGNSRGIRIPADILRRYHMDSSVLMEERSEGILLRPAGLIQEKLGLRTFVWVDLAPRRKARKGNWEGVEEYS